MNIYKFTLLYEEKHIHFAVAIREQDPDKATQIATMYINKTLQGKASIVEMQKTRL